MSVGKIVLGMLKSKEWVDREEFENAFPKKIEGHASWPQRLRDLRLPEYGGYTIIYRTKSGTKHLTEWHLEIPEQDTPHEEIIRRNNLQQEETLNLATVGIQQEWLGR